MTLGNVSACANQWMGDLLSTNSLIEDHTGK